MGLLDVRRLAAIDMHGVAGTRRRQRVILAEFVLGAVVGVIIGVWVAVSAGTAGWQAFGAWVAGIGVNYAALACHAVSLSRPGALDAELTGVDVRRELRRYSLLQFWVVVPLVLGILAIGQSRRPRNAT